MDEWNLNCSDAVIAGAYDSEEAAAHTYDLAALKYWGPDTILNFPVIKIICLVDACVCVFLC